jgi:hypothetical protein
LLQYGAGKSGKSKRPGLTAMGWQAVRTCTSRYRPGVIDSDRTHRMPKREATRKSAVLRGLPLNPWNLFMPILIQK